MTSHDKARRQRRREAIARSRARRDKHGQTIIEARIARWHTAWKLA